MLKLLTRLFGSRNDRIVRGYEATVRKAASFEAALKALSDDGLRAKSDEFRKRLADGENLNQIAPEAFAVVREAAQRTGEILAAAEPSGRAAASIRRSR